MARWLAIAINDHGEAAAAIANDTSGTKLPYGFEGKRAIMDRMTDVSELTVLIEMPDDASFRPEIIEPSEDSEVGVVFIDL